MKKSYFILLFTLSLLATSGYSQQRKFTNLASFDQRKIHFGFLLGYNTADFAITRNSDLSFSDSLLGVESIKQPGFNLGIISSYAFTPGFRVRFLPTLSFQERALEYRFLESDSTQNIEEKRIESTFVEFPINFKFRTMRINNFAAYLIGGVKYSIDLASQKDASQSIADPIIKIDNKAFQWEVGGGTDFFLEYFKFGIELKLSYGFGNVLIQDNTTISSPLESLKIRTLQISLTFEG